MGEKILMKTMSVNANIPKGKGCDILETAINGCEYNIQLWRSPARLSRASFPLFPC